MVFGEPSITTGVGLHPSCGGGKAAAVSGPPSAANPPGDLASFRQPGKATDCTEASFQVWTPQGSLGLHVPSFGYGLGFGIVVFLTWTVIFRIGAAALRLALFLVVLGLLGLTCAFGA